jgi:hypothetical protein
MIPMAITYANVSRPLRPVMQTLLISVTGVPELKDVQGKAVFAPYERLSKEEFEKLGYPKPHVNWKQTKQRCIERYKRDMQDAEP